MACSVTVENGVLDQREIDAYVARAREKYGVEPKGLRIKLDGEFVDLDYDFGPQPFSRIRRITGYLVGTLDRFNNAKRAEESERVRHGLSCSCDD